MFRYTFKTERVVLFINNKHMSDKAFFPVKTYSRTDRTGSAVQAAYMLISQCLKFIPFPAC